MTCTRESITYVDVVFMELQQLLKEPLVHEHPAWPASIRLWQLRCKTYRLIRPPIVTISIVIVNCGWKQGNFIRTWVGFELMYFRFWSNDANRCATPQLLRYQTGFQYALKWIEIICILSSFLSYWLNRLLLQGTPWGRVIEATSFSSIFWKCKSF